MSAASLGDQPKLSVAPSGGSGRDGLGMGSRLQAPPEDEEEDEGIQSDEEEVQLLYRQQIPPPSQPCILQQILLHDAGSGCS